MFVSSKIEYSENQELDGEVGTDFAEDNESSKTLGENESKKEARSNITADEDCDFIKW